MSPTLGIETSEPHVKVGELSENRHFRLYFVYSCGEAAGTAPAWLVLPAFSFFFSFFFFLVD